MNNQGETVTMWLLEKDGKRVENKELQDFLEKHGQELPAISYIELSGEELERRVNDSWKDGVNYLTGQKVSGFSGGVLRSSAYVASVKKTLDSAELIDIGLGLGTAAMRYTPLLAEQIEKLRLAKVGRWMSVDEFEKCLKLVRCKCREMETGLMWLIRQIKMPFHPQQMMHYTLNLR